MITASRLQHVSAGSLALGMHALFLAALVFSLSWKIDPRPPVEADLWAALPEPLPIPAPEPPSQITPAPEPAPPPAPKAADIALKQAELEKRRQAEMAAREHTRLEQEKQREAERLRQEKLAQEQKKKQLEQEAARELERQMQAELAQEEAQREAQRQAQLEAQRRAQELQAQAVRRDRVVADFRERIKTKILGHVRLPPTLTGNPEAVFQVNLFANGDVRNVTLIRSSGVPAYDVEVERAILKASPLPLPAEKDAAQSFRSGLQLTFKPFENGRF